MRFEIRKSKDEQFYYVFIARNGKIMVTSETMTKKRSCIDSIESLVWELSRHDIDIVDTTI